MLPKQNRLRSADFKKLRRACVSSSPHFIMRIARGAHPAAGKVAAVVSVKVAQTAVGRNLLRRRIYETVRSRLSFFGGAQMVIQAKQGASALSFKELQDELSSLVQRI